jgi:hypothetical protein
MPAAQRLPPPAARLPQPVPNIIVSPPSDALIRREAPRKAQPLHLQPQPAFQLRLCEGPRRDSRHLSVPPTAVVAWYAANCLFWLEWQVRTEGGRDLEAFGEEQPAPRLICVD